MTEMLYHFIILGNCFNSILLQFPALITVGNTLVFGEAVPVRGGKNTELQDAFVHQA